MTQIPENIMQNNFQAKQFSVSYLFPLSAFQAKSPSVSSSFSLSAF
jgi:hypothetical protein